MILKIFAVYDIQVGSYLRPFFAQTKGQVIRELADVVNDPEKKVQFAKHPSDYALFELATFDDETAKVEPYLAPERVIMLHELQKVPNV